MSDLTLPANFEDHITRSDSDKGKCKWKNGNIMNGINVDIVLNYI